MAQPEAGKAAIAGTGITKRFGAVRALEDAGLSASFGEIHALVGENGAGKSTMIKVLSGLHAPDSGVVKVQGQEVRLRNPQAAYREGIGSVFQELTLLPWLSVADNLLIRREPRRYGLVLRGALPARAEALLSSYGVDSIDPRALVTSLSLAQQQILEIVRAASREPRILFLDEPTSSLPEREVEWLFGLLRRLREEGTCIVFTSHRWREVSELADRVTIFRSGHEVATRSRFAEDEAIRLMTGHSVEQRYTHPERPAQSDPVLAVTALRADGLDNVSFGLRPGEILGVGGLEGQGQRELFQVLFGMLKPKSGEVEVGGKRVDLRTPRDAIRAGIALVPEDRKGEGLLLPMSVKENITLATLGQRARGGFLRLGAERGAARDTIERLQIRARDSAQAVGQLSGGNQQKVLIGRWLLTDARVLLLYDVTRGVDVATKQDLYRLMAQLAGEGRAIVYYSSDTEEIAAVSHRVLVMRNGAVAAELAGPGIDPEEIVGAAIREEVTQL